jgi:hypothetical protein
MNTKLSSLTAVVVAMIIVGSRFYYYYYSYHSKYTNSRCSDDAPLATSSGNVYVVWCGVMRQDRMK